MKARTTPLLTTKLNAYGNHREVLAKDIKGYGLSPVRYANATQARNRLAKMPDVENWTICGHNPYYVAKA